MSSRGFIAVAAVFTAGAAAWTLWPRAPVVPDGSGATQVPTLVPLELPRPPEPRATGEVATSPAPTPPEAGEAEEPEPGARCHVAGVVLLDGAPAAGARVSRFGSSAQAVCDQLGRFRLDPAQCGEAPLRAERGPASALVPVWPGDGVRIELGEGGARVAVVDASSGAPLPDAKLWLMRQEQGGFHAFPAELERQGEVTLVRGLRAGGYRLSAATERHEKQDVPFRIEGRGVVDVRIALRPIPVFRGRVVDEAGHPLERTTVSCGLDSAISVSTGATGDFELVCPDGEPVVFARLAGRASGQGYPRGGPIDIVLREPVPLEVRVESAAGRPVPGAEVTLRALGEAQQAFRATTTERGLARFEEAGPGRYLAWAVAKGHAKSDESPLTLGGAGVAQLLITLPDALRISGKVVRPDGSPAAGARVKAASASGPIPAGANGIYAQFWATAGEDGRFELQGLSRGPYAIEAVSGPDFSLMEVAAAGSSDLRLKLSP